MVPRVVQTLSRTAAMVTKKKEVEPKQGSGSKYPSPFGKPKAAPVDAPMPGHGPSAMDAAAGQMPAQLPMKKKIFGKPR
jgi:hypothetical protein